MSFEDPARQRQVRLGEVRDLRFSDGHAGRPVRVVRSAESWVEARIVGGKKRRKAQQRQWLWAANDGWAGHGARTICHAGHRRWGIENKAFNELTQGYHLDHCYHHEPVSMLVQMLILMPGFTLFTVFAELHCKVVRLGATTLMGLAQELNLALEEDLPWEQWFACG